MVRKILLGIVALLLLTTAGAYVLIKTKGDVLLQKFSAYVEETTGAPLVMEALPSLTFFPQPGLDLGRASWGREDSELSVRFERASVRVSAKSLLAGRLDITDMEVDGLDVTVRQAADKASPVETPVNAAPPAPTAGNNETGKDAGDSARLEAALTRILTVAPNALTVHDGRVRLLLPDAATEFSHIDLNLKNVRPGADAALTLKADIGSSRPDFSGALELTAEAALSDSNLTLALRKAVFTPAAGPAANAPLSLSGDGAYALRDGALTVSSLAFSGPDVLVTTSGTVANLPALLRDPLHAAVPAALNFTTKGSPRAVLAALGLSAPVSNPSALTAAALSGRLDMNEGILKISALDGTLDSIPFSGTLEYRPASLSLSGSLQAGDVRLDPYLPASGPEAKATTQTPPPSPASKSGATAKSGSSKAAPRQLPELNLALRVRSLEAAGVRAEDIQARLEGKNNVYALNPLTCRAFGSPVTAALTAAVKSNGVNATANLSASHIDLKQLSAILFPSLPLEGVGTLNTSLACFSADPLSTLSGKGSLSAAPLGVNIDILPPNAPAVADAARHARFDKAMLTFEAAKGIITITDCAMNAPKINATGKGIVNLPARTLDLSGAVQLPGLAVLPVRLTGPLSAPTYSLNARTTFEAVDRTLKEQGVDLKQEIQKGLGRLLRKK